MRKTAEKPKNYYQLKREYHRWWSWNLEREMELIVFGHSGAKVLVFPTRGGRFHEYENLRMTELLREKIDAGFLHLFSKTIDI